MLLGFVIGAGVPMFFFKRWLRAKRRASFVVWAQKFVNDEVDRMMFGQQQVPTTTSYPPISRSRGGIALS